MKTIFKLAFYWIAGLLIAVMISAVPDSAPEPAAAAPDITEIRMARLDAEAQRRADAVAAMYAAMSDEERVRGDAEITHKGY